MSIQPAVSNIRNVPKSTHNLTEDKVRKLLSDCMRSITVDSLIQIAKESPIGIASDISIPVVLQYSHSNDMYNIITAR